MSEGHLYRIAEADAAILRSLAAALVGVPCLSFGGAATWDVVPSRGRANLRPIAPIADAAALAALDVSGDFGHVFSDRAELRWRRSDEGRYDVLVLSETSLNIVGAEELLCHWTDEAGEPRSEPWHTSSPGSPAVLQDGNLPPLRYIAYHAPNGAVLFLRYTGVHP